MWAEFRLTWAFGKMKLPRDLSGADLAKALRRLGYETTRQTGSHLRLTTPQDGQHHLTSPTTRPSKWEPWPVFLQMWLLISPSPATSCSIGFSVDEIT